MSHTRTAPNTKARSLSPPEEDKASGLGCLPPPSPHLLSVGACDEGVLQRAVFHRALEVVVHTKTASGVSGAEGVTPRSTQNTDAERT